MMYLAITNVSGCFLLFPMDPTTSSINGTHYSDFFCRMVALFEVSIVSHLDFTEKSTQMFHSFFSTACSLFHLSKELLLMCAASQLNCPVLSNYFY